MTKCSKLHVNLRRTDDPMRGEDADRWTVTAVTWVVEPGPDDVLTGEILRTVETDEPELALMVVSLDRKRLQSVGEPRRFIG